MLATGGPGIVFGRSTNSIINTGTAAGRAYLEGAVYANGEFIQVHPTSIPGEDKLRLMSESVRGEGGRVWVPKKKGDTRDPLGHPREERWYFLEEKYPKYKNLVPRDVATREIFHVCRELGMGIGGRDGVYLDVTHIPAATLDAKIKGVMEIYEKFVGDDPRRHPMVIFPGMHYSMGGLWVSFEPGPNLEPLAGSPRNQATSIPGLFAAGEADYAYHGANRLGANSLLSCIYGGHDRRAGHGEPTRRTSPRARRRFPPACFEDAKKQWTERFATIDQMTGTENPYVLARELGEVMTENVTVVRHNDRLGRRWSKLAELKDRWKRINVLDHGHSSNRPLSFVNQLWNMFALGEVITKSALLRDESRGAHYKPEFSAPRAEDQGPHPGSGVDEGCGRSATRSGRRPPSPGGRRRARRSPTRTSPRPCSTPSRAGTPEDRTTPWTKPPRLDRPPRAAPGRGRSGSPSGSGGRRAPAQPGDFEEFRVP